MFVFMMCLETFKNKGLSDFNSWNEWVLFINKNYKYSQNQSNVKDFKGKCKNIDLPSYHPYWNLMYKLGLRKHLLRIVIYYNECLIDSNKIKYYFNETTSIKSIEKEIKNLRQKIYFD
jgi:hypothetical protein